MSEGDFSGLSLVATTDDGDSGGGVMRRAERTGGDNAVGFAGDGVDFGDGDLFFRRWGGKEISGSAGEKSFAGAGRAGNKDVVMAGNGDSKGTLGEGLAANVVQNWASFICFCIFYNIRGGVNDELFSFEVEEEFTEIFDANEANTRYKGSLGEVV